MWISRSRFDDLEAQIKALKTALDAKADKDFGVGDKTRVYVNQWPFYGYRHHITLHEAVRKLAEHLGLQFRMTDAKPAVAVVEKLPPHGIYEWLVDDPLPKKTAKKKR